MVGFVKFQASDDGRDEETRDHWGVMAWFGDVNTDETLQQRGEQGV